MKDLVLLPLRFVAVLIVFLLVFTGVQVLIEYSQLPETVSASVDYSLVPLIFKSLTTYSVPAIVLSWLLIAFHILHRKRFRALLLTILAICTAGITFLAAISEKPVSFYTQTLDRHPPFQVPEQRILADDRGFVLIQKDENDKVYDILYHSQAIGESFRVIGEGTKDASTRTVIFPEDGLSLQTDSILGGRDSMFRAPAFFGDFAGLMTRALHTIHTIFSQGLITQLSFAIGLTIYLTGLWLFVRATRWPLFNVFLSIAGGIGMFGLTVLASEPGISGLVSLLPVFFQSLALPAVLVIVGILLIGINLFLPPVKDWQREAAT